MVSIFRPKGNQIFAIPLILLILIPVIGEAEASSIVQITKNVIINTKFGRLTILSSNIIINLLVVYANGTVYMDLVGLERSQVAYQFTSQSYGNGTFDTRFNVGLLPTLVKSVGSASTIIGLLTRITYTASQSNLLELDFIPLANPIVANAAVFASVWFPLIFINLGGLFGVGMAEKMIATMQQRQPRVSMRMIATIGVISVIGWTLLIVFDAQAASVMKGLGI